MNYLSASTLAIAVLIVGFNNHGYSQNAIRIYYNTDDERCGLENAHYYRVVPCEAANAGRYDVSGYYMSGELRTRGVYSVIDTASCLDSARMEIEQGKHVYYYKNGNIERTTQYLDGKKEGESIAFYEGGAIMSRRSYISDELNGDEVWYYENGSPNVFRQYQNGKIDGIEQYLYEDGALEYQCRYINGLEDGIEKWYYNTGEIKIERAYEHGALNGEEKNYYKSGQLSQITPFECNELHGELRLFYEDGNVRMSAQYANGIQNGAEIEFFENGAISRKIMYEDGCPRGVEEYFYDTGEEYIRVPYANCMRNGEVRLYYKNGLVERSMHFVDDKLVGEVVDYYINGHIEQLTTYSDSIRDGQYYSSDSLGRTISSGSYVDGKKSGKWAHYENGLLKSYEIFHEDEQSGWYEEYRADGTISRSGNLEDGKESGVWWKFDENGRLEALYRNDERGLVEKGMYYSRGPYGTWARLFEVNFDTTWYTWTADTVDDGNYQYIAHDGYHIVLGEGDVYSNYFPVQASKANDWSAELEYTLTAPSDTMAIIELITQAWNYATENAVTMVGTDFVLRDTYDSRTIRYDHVGVVPYLSKDTVRMKMAAMKLGKTIYLYFNDSLYAEMAAPLAHGPQFGVWIRSFMESYHVILNRMVVTVRGLTDSEVEQVVNEDMPIARVGTGTAFAINEDGYFATCAHVISGAEKITMRLRRDGQERSFIMQTVLQDDANDLAIIKVIDEDFSPYGFIPYGISDTMASATSKVHMFGYALGDAGGRPLKYTAGYVSSLSGVDDDMKTYTMSLPAYHGNSGGPIFGDDGNIIALLSAGMEYNENQETEVANTAVKSPILIGLMKAYAIEYSVNPVSEMKTNKNTYYEVLHEYIGEVIAVSEE